MGRLDEIVIYTLLFWIADIMYRYANAKSGGREVVSCANLLSPRNRYFIVASYGPECSKCYKHRVNPKEVSID